MQVRLDVFEKEHARDALVSFAMKPATQQPPVCSEKEVAHLLPSQGESNWRIEVQRKSKIVIMATKPSRHSRAV